MTTRQSVLHNSPSILRVLDTPRSLVEQHLATLALHAEAAIPLKLFPVLALLAIHFVGLGAFWRYYHQPIWLAIPTLAVLLFLPLLVFPTRRYLAVETLAPLFFLYAILVARVIAVRVLLANEPYQDEASFADPRFVAFQVEATVAAVAGYLAVAQTTRLVRVDRRSQVIAVLAVILGAASIAWFAIETISHRTQGVTATDPYAYVQMAVDLATRGTLAHSFRLFPFVANLGVSWYPVEHIGYRLFDNLSGTVPTVWPFGGSLWLALAFRLWGEQGLYLATPLAGIGALLAMLALAWEYLNDKSLVVRASTSALALLLLATSWEQVDRSIVPLVDVQAQLFSTLVILFALWGARRKEKWWVVAILAGLAVGAAYLVRHTQLLMAPLLIIAVWKYPWGERVRFLLVAAAAAFITALPDLWYHKMYLGDWVTPESHEMALFSASSIMPSLNALSTRFFAGNEFGYLVPFLVYGSIRAGRENCQKFTLLIAWLLVLTGFHTLYEAVKLRDLLPEYPAAILLTAFGMVSLVRDLRGWAGEGTSKRVVVGIVLYLVLLMPSMRDRITILRPFQPAKVTFGFVTSEQRESFDRIASLTPEDAVIGSAMNDGAIDLYAQRDTFRPGAWTSGESERFVETVLKANRSVYLLDDGAETSAARHELESRYVFRRIAVLDVPLFGSVVGTPGALYQIILP